MSEEEKNQPAADQVEVGTQQFSDQLEKLLSKLVPPDNLTLRLFDGEEVVLPGALPARRQIKVFRKMKELLETDKVQGAMRASTASTAGVVDMIVNVATDEEIIEALGDIFQEAYPDALPEGSDPLDLLPLEELVSSLVPFTERFIQKMGTGLMLVAEAADNS